MVHGDAARLVGQGWKLHVSATQLAAPVVLARVADTVVRNGCAFKFARGLNQLWGLLSNQYDRGVGGKFITVYPEDDEQFRRLAAELDRVTDGLPDDGARRSVYRQPLSPNNATPATPPRQTNPPLKA